MLNVLLRGFGTPWSIVVGPGMMIFMQESCIVSVRVAGRSTHFAGDMGAPGKSPCEYLVRRGGLRVKRGARILRGVCVDSVVRFFVSKGRCHLGGTANVHETKMMQHIHEYFRAPEFGRGGRRCQRTPHSPRAVRGACVSQRRAFPDFAGRSSAAGGVLSFNVPQKMPWLGGAGP